MKNILRGGQTSIHSFRMSAQLVFTLLKVAVLVAVITAIGFVLSKFDFYDFKSLAIYFLAKFLVACGAVNFEFSITDRAGNVHHLKASVIAGKVVLEILKNSFFSAIIRGLIIGFATSFLAIGALVYLFNFRGKKLAKEQFIRGGKIVSRLKLKSLIKKSNLLENVSLQGFSPEGFLPRFSPKFSSRLFSKPYSLAKIPFPNDAEFLHSIILGSTGTGKTNAILELLDQIRKKGDAAIIYDKMGTYTASYYNSQTDIILNPFDQRAKSWSFFNEIRAQTQESDYDYIASAFIPENKGGSDPFWIKSAKRVFAAFAQKIKAENPNVTNQEFVDALMRTNYKQIAQFLAQSEAASLISVDSEKTSLGILAILASYVASIKYLRDDNPKNPNQESQEKFSIRNWVESIGSQNSTNFSNSPNSNSPSSLNSNSPNSPNSNKTANGFLFISSKGDQHESLKPLISTWLDIAIKSLLSVEQNQPKSQEPRRIWIIIDEVASLQALPSILDGLAQSRQFGGAFVLSLHSVSQLKSIYGKDTTDTITSLCRNKIFFAVPDNETAEFCSTNLGFQEVEEVKEGISYGANEIRDGVNLNTQKSLKRLVIPSQLMFMKRLQAYIKFAGEFPVAKISFKIKNRKKVSERFVERLPQQETLNTETRTKNKLSLKTKTKAKKAPKPKEKPQIDDSFNEPSFNELDEDLTKPIATAIATSFQADAQVDDFDEDNYESGDKNLEYKNGEESESESDEKSQEDEKDNNDDQTKPSEEEKDVEDAKEDAEESSEEEDINKKAKDDSNKAAESPVSFTNFY